MVRTSSDGYISTTLRGQNLIINGSFEEFDECCKYYGQLETTKGWFQLGGSTDYYNTCCTKNDFLDVPSNFSGYQFPKEGNAYVGIVLFSSADPKYRSNGFYYREYIHTKLKSPLQSGKKYKISFYYSLAENSKLFTDHFSVAFSNDKQLRHDKFEGNLLISTNFVVIKVGDDAKDTIEWHEATCDYIAKGGEQYFILGTFLNDLSRAKFRTLNNNVVNTKGKNCYYYIDSVSLESLDQITKFSHHR